MGFGCQRKRKGRIDCEDMGGGRASRIAAVCGYGDAAENVGMMDEMEKLLIPFIFAQCQRHSSRWIRAALFDTMIL